MPPVKRLLQRMQHFVGLCLRPGEPGPDARDLNLRPPSHVNRVDHLPGQLPPVPMTASEERLKRWRERQQLSRAGPWQMK